jgi:hypothetical protein
MLGVKGKEKQAVGELYDLFETVRISRRIAIWCPIFLS